MYVYIRSEPGLYTVGHYTPAGNFIPESDHVRDDDAAKRVAWLNGSGTDIEPRFVVMCVPPREQDHDDQGVWFVFDRTTGVATEHPSRKAASDACRRLDES
jgi:hypothetical protein